MINKKGNPFEFPFICILLAEFATIAFIELASEALLYEVVETIAKGLERHVVDDLVDEGILQKELGLIE